MKIFVSFIVLCFVNAHKIRNSSFTLFEVYPTNMEQAYELKTFGDFSKALFIKQGIRELFKKFVNILVPKMIEETFGQYLVCRRMNFNVIKDISPWKVPKLIPDMGNINFQTYHRFDVIRSYLQTLAWKYPNLVTLENIGKSSEGRDLTAIKISTGGNKTKSMIFIDAGIHGNEWMGPAQALYIIQQLVENPQNLYLIKNVDWLIFPVVNPDGYEYSLSVDPMWRKSRSKGIYCTGVDLNRNFNFYWWLPYGSSTKKCDNTYRGRRPFSEPESQAVIVYPWGYTQRLPTNANELFYLGKRVASAIETVSGTRYDVGQIPDVMYPVTGDSISWAKGVVGINLSYAIELPPKTTDLKNIPFPLPCIKFTQLEMFEGIKAFHQYIEKKFAFT